MCFLSFVDCFVLSVSEFMASDSAALPILTRSCGLEGYLDMVEEVGSESGRYPSGLCFGSVHSRSRRPGPARKIRAHHRAAQNPKSLKPSLRLQALALPALWSELTWFCWMGTSCPPRRCRSPDRTGLCRALTCAYHLAEVFWLQLLLL